MREESRHRTYHPDLSRVSPRTLVCIADDDVSDPTDMADLEHDATLLGITPRIVEGHIHDTAFEDVDLIAPMALAHLATVCESKS